MKKALLSVFAVVLSLSVFAQVQTVKDKNAARMAKANTFASATTADCHTAKDATPTWKHIHTPFTTTDINSNTIDVAAILASGKAIVIDYSATWCNPCYQLHQSKNLEAIHDALSENVVVLWVEADDATTLADIEGTGSNTRGDWTHYSDGSAVSYPIIDCASCESMIDPTGYVPAVYFIAPSGYYCHIYAESWGFGISTSNADAVAAVQNLLTLMPQSGDAPTDVAIVGNSTIPINTSLNLTAQYVSVDAATVSWSFPGGTPTSATGDNATVTYSTPGTYTVTLEVDNGNGNVSCTLDVQVIEYSWGDEMDYTNGGTYENAIGLSSGNAFEWGVLYPASFLTGRNYVTNVSAYISVSTEYTLHVYQGGTTAPSTSIFEQTYAVTESEQWVDFPLPGGLAIDPTQNLWVTLTASGYVASYAAYNGDPNSCMLSLSETWSNLIAATSGSYEGSWMIKTTTSATEPSFDFIISGPASGATNHTLNFSINGPSSATYNWTFQGATPASATGMTASATWSSSGYYTVSVTGTHNGNNVTHTMQVGVNSCDIIAYPYEEGFEGDIDCWTKLDADGDGYTWEQNARGTTHAGSGNIASASFSNDVGVLNPDNWLISPRLNLPDESAQIEWYEYGDENSDYAEHYGLYVSTSGTNISDFTQVWEGTVPAGKTWRQLTQSLDAYRGQSIYIAFRHYNCSDMFWLIIDDVKVTGTGHVGIDDVEHLNVAVYPNPTTGRFHINAEGFENVEVFDVTGRNVMTADKTVIDLSSFANGVYTLRVNTVKGSSMQKIVKK